MSHHFGDLYKNNLISPICGTPFVQTAAGLVVRTSNDNHLTNLKAGKQFGRELDFIPWTNANKHIH